MKNLFDDLDEGPGAEERFDVLAVGPALRVERIVSRGHSTPPEQWYDQAEAEWVVLLQGEASLQWEDGTQVALKAGDHVFIAAHRRHRVTHTSVAPACVWLAVHGDLHQPDDAR
ncbi:MAG: cupin domain-containing protein [Bradymonadaceae bacterium]|nr:cupin domain-containing protein [Lujinxingiaceae bacterium]